MYSINSEKNDKSNLLNFKTQLLFFASWQKKLKKTCCSLNEKLISSTCLIKGQNGGQKMSNSLSGMSRCELKEREREREGGRKRKR